MSIARHHAEWLSLLEIDGPFLSMPVLLRAFPQGLPADDPELARELRLVYEEWLDDQGGLKPDPAMHRAWVLWVLRNLLEWDDEVLIGGLKGGSDPRLDALATDVAEQHETLRPDFALADVHASRDEDDDAPAVRALIMVVPPGQGLERPLADRRWKASPATRMMTLLHASDVRVGLVTNGERWMLVDAPKGETTAFVSWYARLWLDERLTQRAFRSVLGAERFFGVPDEETVEGLLAASADHQKEVTDQLGFQVREAVEILVDAIDRADQDRGRELLEGLAMSELYQASVTVMMRLVFLFSAEERDLLLLGDPLYDDNYAVSTLAARLREAADRHGEEVLGRRHDAWGRLLATFRAVHAGVEHDRMRLPAYGGGLFDPDRFPFLEGRTPGSRWRETASRPLPIDNRTVLHLLEALQLLRVHVPGGGGAETQRLSFRALGIEQIGHVYEGLLDHKAARAEDAVLGLRGTKNKEPEVEVGRLEEAQLEGEDQLIRLLRDETGRSSSPLKKALTEEDVDAEQQSKLLGACGNDEELLYRIRPFAHLIRDDSYGTPYVIKPKSAYVTGGTDRRATGTHYTPRSLTEPIVRRTLEPVVYRGPAEGAEREDWQLKGPAELLDLKVCDMAMGSGAFLVQACRYLSERLMEAWESAEQSDRTDAAAHSDSNRRDITPEGVPTDDSDQAIPRDPIDREMLSLRLIATRCLYGVDKNPLAVEMAKLSMWLLTLAKGQRFTFLDHAFKCGDSLVGLSREQLELFHWEQPKKDSQMLLSSDFIAARLKEAEELRRWVREAGSEVSEAELKLLNAQAEAALEDVRLVGDVVIWAFFEGGSKKAKEGRRLAAWERVRGWLTGDGDRDWLVAKAHALRTHDHPVPTLHWPIEYPEVFDREPSGFDAIVGNPPFAGKNTMAAGHHAHYPDWLKTLHEGAHGNSDIVAHFYRRAFALNAPVGTSGLIATNTIAQGDTRSTGLAWICQHGGTIYAADRRVPWPGQAAVIVSVVHVRKGTYDGSRLLDGSEVDRITAFLFHMGSDEDPKQLAANAGKSFQGSIVLGMGFTFDDTDSKGVATPIAEMHRLIEKDPRNAEVIFPYIGGAEVNSSPTHAHHRYVINFGERGEEECRERWPDLMAIVEEKVKPERMKLRDNSDGRRRKTYWWQFGRHTPALFTAMEGLERVLAHAFTSKYLQFAFVPSDVVVAGPNCVFALERYSVFAAVQCSVHEIWARFVGSSHEDRLRYTTSDCFETFPFPHDFERGRRLDAVGTAYYDFRAKLMDENDEGLTDTYNRFHDPDESSPAIHELRELHAAMDRAVLDAYGWTDIPTDCQFILDYEVDESSKGKKPWRYRWPDEVRDEVLGRLMALNQERYEEEVAEGLHGAKAKRALAMRGASVDDVIGERVSDARAEGGAVQAKLL